MNSISIFRTIVPLTSRMFGRRCITSGTSVLRKVFVVENNDQFMEKVMNSDIPVVVNFHAEWCEPCKILSPKLLELLEPSELIHLAIVDVETNPELVHTFEVKAVPAVLAIRNGLVIDKFIGLVDAKMIDSLINKLIATGGKIPVDTSDPIPK